LTLVIVFLVILVLVGLNALYVAAEFATVGSRRPRVSEMASSGDRAAQRLLPIMENPGSLDRYVAACQIGITLSSIIVGFYGQAQLAPYLQPLLASLGWVQPGAAVVVSTLLILVFLTLFQVIFGELLPKSVALRYPERLALATLRPMIWSLFVLRPFIAFLNGSAFAIMRAVGLSIKAEHSHVHSPEELEALFHESARGGLIDAGEREMLQNVLHLQDRLARQIMVPRTRMNVISADEQPADVYRTLLTSPHTRFPVFEGTPDRIVGVVHLKDLALAVQEVGESTLRSFVREVLLLPESISVSDLWEQMRLSKQHLVVLFDEYGGVSGLVTLEDVLEEVFGELQDEFDQETEPVQLGADGRVFLRADLLVSAVALRFALTLPDDADTIGGLVLSRLEDAPRVGDEVAFDALVFRVDAVDEHGIRQVSVVPPSERETAAGDDGVRA
jgi:putative hemolysin